MDIDFAAIQNLAENGPLIEVSVNGHAVRALIDTGSPVTCIRVDLGKSYALSEKSQWYDNRRQMFFPVYEANIEIAGRRFDNHEVNALPIRSEDPFVFLVGRDILVSFVFEYDGQNGMFALR